LFTHTLYISQQQIAEDSFFPSSPKPIRHSTFLASILCPDSFEDTQISELSWNDIIKREEFRIKTHTIHNFSLFEAQRHSYRLIFI